LNRLIYAYIRKVPWESVSRIVRRHTVAATSDCPRWPEEFWDCAIGYGFGGTCFESTLAFYSLLSSLGYEGYLTVNNMGDTRGCHAAIILLLNGSKYLVDVTIPVHASIRVEPGKTTRRSTVFHDYTLLPAAENVYEVERSHHPKRNAFTLIDAPVSLPDYRAIVTKDYSDTGLFLKSVVIVKVIGDKVWRFFSDPRPYKVESFNRTTKNETIVPPEALAPILAALFHLPQDCICDALSYINNCGERT
jgi:arylamine N-acetyltransferase